MYNLQANSTRYIYTLSATKPPDPITWCKLNSSGFYLTKESRSDEKMRFTELDMYAIIRTICFIYVFNYTTPNTLLEIINLGEISIEENCNICPVQNITINIFINLLDGLFGSNFSRITKRPLGKVYNEYRVYWLYGKIAVPSAEDYIKMARFRNIYVPRFSIVTQFINKNSTDHKIHLQEPIKRLK